MSRIGNDPVSVVNGVDIKIDANVITVKGPKGELTQDYDSSAVTIKQEDEKLVFERTTDHKNHRAKHGLYRALLANMIEGVTKGWVKKLEFHGVGYRAVAKGQQLEMVIGFSHPVIIEIP